MKKWKAIVRGEFKDKAKEDIKYVKTILQDTELSRKEEIEELKKNGRIISTVVKEWVCLKYGRYVSAFLYNFSFL